MCPSCRSVTEVTIPFPVLQSFPDFNDINLGAWSDGKLSNLLPYGENDVRPSLQADFTVSQDKWVWYSVEVPTTVDGFFKLGIHVLNVLYNGIIGGCGPVAL